MNILRNIWGGESMSLHLLILFILLLWWGAVAEQPPYIGAMLYFDSQPNNFIRMNEHGTLQIGETFLEGEWRLWVDPYGIIALGTDDDYEITKSVKWYRIEGTTFIQSPDLLPAKYAKPIVWTSTPFRVIVGVYPNRVWQLNPRTLKAQMLCEYWDMLAVGVHATLVNDLGYLFYTPGDFQINRVNYNIETGKISGPAVVFPTPYRGVIDQASTSDGRTIVAIDGDDLMVHRSDDNGIPLTTSYYNNPFGMSTMEKVRVSPNNRFVFIIGSNRNNINSFELHEEGHDSGILSPITQLTGFDLAQALAITPDGKYLVVAHHYFSGYPRSIISVFEITSDGALIWLPEKDTPWKYTIAEILFFPPPQWPTTSRTSWENYY